eukprot:CAMPEP_0197465674 /NCGR_PEP_ID=MMETSP1175-20131217/64661_1 /TAXON_ID=1003142 /ORGANISM="Triceratium dubium, Strain CCMP147" /LENGTH=322 /DNA_ID=CAMNT_0043001693 /DNA_START=169 /DNA_END=1137 /DNA_ORIENTATION=-
MSLTLTSIHTLLENQKWQQAEDLLQADPSRHAYEIGGCFKSLPLMTALMSDPPVWIIDSLIEKNPAAVSSKNEYGMIPLRTAIRSHASLEVINAILREDPESIKSFGVSGKTCLHLACLYSKNEPADEALVDRLLELWPEAAQWTDRDGWHALHIACFNKVGPSIVRKLLVACDDAATKADSPEHQLPLHIAAKCGADAETLKLIYDKYPEAIKLRTKNDGLLPLHLACSRKDVAPSEIEALLSFYPDAAKETGRVDGSLPLHVASRSGCSMAVLKILHEAYPRAMMEKNRMGDTPFACAAGKSESQRNLNSLEESGPQSAQ